MGSCLGRCGITRDSFSFYKLHYNRGERVDFEHNATHNVGDLQNGNNESNFQDEIESLHMFGQLQKQSRFKRFKAMFSNLKRRHQGSTSVRLELLDDAWSTSEIDHAASYENVHTPTRLSCAKIRSAKSVHSTPGNSLDLEWEHLPEMAVLTNITDKEDQQRSATSASAWSRLSSPDSLEWDPVEGEMKDEVDAETEQLLQEIERLSSRTLRETQEWAS